MYILNRMHVRRPRSTLYGFAAVFLLLTGCSADINVRGSVLDPDRVKSIKVGVQNKAAVRNLLGSPTNIAPFSGETWYYISQQDRTPAFRQNRSISRTVFAVSFDDNGIVKKIRNLSLADGKKVAFVERQTPTPGREFSLIQQLIGNLGRFETPTGENQ